MVLVAKLVKAADADTEGDEDANTDTAYNAADTDTK